MFSQIKGRIQGVVVMGVMSNHLQLSLVKEMEPDSDLNYIIITCNVHILLTNKLLKNTSLRIINVSILNHLTKGGF